MESKDTTILSMNERFERLSLYLEEWSVDAMPVLKGESILFEDFPPSDDTILSSLTYPSACDDLVHVILQVLFSAFSTLISHLVEDHLPGSKHSIPSS